MSDLNTLYDEQTAAVMRKVLERDSNCVDVGCHVGSILDEMCKLAPGGHHHAFEPLPNFYEHLIEKFTGFTNVTFHELALSDAPGTSTFQYVVTSPGFSGLLRRRYDRADEQVEEITVKLERLDEVLPADYVPRMIKVDVEGGELGVLRGAVETLTRCKPFVVFEHGQGSADFYGTRPEQVFDLYARCGLRVSLMGDWLEGKPSLTRQGLVTQFDTPLNYYFLAHP